MRKINLGLTVQINKKDDSFWVNGIKQNAVTLRDMFALCPNVKQAKLVNLGSLRDYDGTVWEEYKEHLVDFNTFADDGDMLITATVTPTPAMAEVCGDKNIPIVKHIMGNEIALFIAHTIYDFENQFNSYNKRKNYKAVWISPHIYEHNKSFFEVVTDSPASIGPYIWTDRFINEHAKGYKERHGKEATYEPSGKKEKRISVFEPNIGYEKTCVLPVVALEKLYNKHPDLIEFVNIFGSDNIKNKKIFVEFASSLNINKGKKLFFEARYPIVWSLNAHTDIMLAHQHDLSLNYAYFDAAWLGFPVVHNAHMVKDLGFYYPEWDGEKAAAKLKDVISNFDKKYHKNYMEKSRKIIKKYFWNNQKNIDGYAKLIEDVLK